MMKKKLPKAAKIGLMVFGALLMIYIAFCLADCVRLRKSKMYTPPLITISVTEDKQEGYSYYKGLGYTMRYSIAIPLEKPIDMGEISVTHMYNGDSADFVWLGVPIWSWAL